MRGSQLRFLFVPVCPSLPPLVLFGRAGEVECRCIASRTRAASLSPSHSHSHSHSLTLTPLSLAHSHSHSLYIPTGCSSGPAVSMPLAIGGGCT